MSLPLLLLLGFLNAVDAQCAAGVTQTCDKPTVSCVPCSNTIWGTIMTAETGSCVAGLFTTTATPQFPCYFQGLRNRILALPIDVQAQLQVILDTQSGITLIAPLSIGWDPTQGTATKPTNYACLGDELAYFDNTQLLLYHILQNTAYAATLMAQTSVGTITPGNTYKLVTQLESMMTSSAIYSGSPPMLDNTVPIVTSDPTIPNLVEAQVVNVQSGGTGLFVTEFLKLAGSAEVFSTFQFEYPVSNGLIWLVDKVLLPPKMLLQLNNNIITTAKSLPSALITSFISGLFTIGLIGTGLDGTNGNTPPSLDFNLSPAVTFFAPTNTAYTRLTNANLLTVAQQLQVLSYHVIPGDLEQDPTTNTPQPLYTSVILEQTSPFQVNTANYQTGTANAGTALQLTVAWTTNKITVTGATTLQGVAPVAPAVAASATVVYNDVLLWNGVCQIIDTMLFPIIV